jgi:hypothetical protein
MAGHGSIVNVSSVAGVKATPRVFAYATAKGGLQALTRSVAADYARDRIRCNSVIVGFVISIPSEVRTTIHRASIYHHAIYKRLRGRVSRARWRRDGRLVTSGHGTAAHRRAGAGAAAGQSWRPDGVPSRRHPRRYRSLRCRRPPDEDVATLIVAPWPVIDPQTGRLAFLPDDERTTAVVDIRRCRRASTASAAPATAAASSPDPSASATFWVGGYRVNPAEWEQVIDAPALAATRRRLRSSRRPPAPRCPTTPGTTDRRRAARPHAAGRPASRRAARDAAARAGRVPGRLSRPERR